MPYESNKQAAYLHIHHPEITAKWREEGHGYVRGGKNDPNRKKRVEKALKGLKLLGRAKKPVEQAVSNLEDPFGPTHHSYGALVNRSKLAAGRQPSRVKSDFENHVEHRLHAGLRPAQYNAPARVAKSSQWGANNAVGKASGDTLTYGGLGTTAAGLGTLRLGAELHHRARLRVRDPGSVGEKLVAGQIKRAKRTKMGGVGLAALGAAGTVAGVRRKMRASREMAEESMAPMYYPGG